MRYAWQRRQSNMPFRDKAACGLQAEGVSSPPRQPMSQYFLTQTLWIGCAILQTLTLLRLRSQNLHREYPWFFAYTLFHVVRFTILFTIFHAAPYTWYFVGYWSAELVAAVFTFGVLYEIYRAVFSRDEGL